MATAMGPLHVYRAQPIPTAVIVLVVGLCGSEYSPYVVDIVRGTPQHTTIIVCCGLECVGCATNKLFVKNDARHVVAAGELARKLGRGTPVVGIGISLGGALVLQAHRMRPDIFSAIAMISTSIWYEHALSTMSSTYRGKIVQRVLSWWQFQRLFWTLNVLHGHLTWRDWLALSYGTMLQQDAVLCDAYGIDCSTYIDSLDLRQAAVVAASTIPVKWLVSTNDPMFSEAHWHETRSVVRGSAIQATFTDVGSHGEFTVTTRNDYLVAYVCAFIASVRP